MQMRQLKRSKMATMCYALFGPLGPVGTWVGGKPIPFIPAMGEVLKATDLQEAFKQGMAEQAAKFVVSRAKDGDVVLEADTREEALALVLKHAKQRKAKLVVHQGGEPVLFGEEEVA